MTKVYWALAASYVSQLHAVFRFYTTEINCPINERKFSIKKCT